MEGATVLKMLPTDIQNGEDIMSQLMQYTGLFYLSQVKNVHQSEFQVGISKFQARQEKQKIIVGREDLCKYKLFSMCSVSQ